MVVSPDRIRLFKFGSLVIFLSQGRSDLEREVTTRNEKVARCSELAEGAHWYEIYRDRRPSWRECKGVEPSAHIEGCTPAELKSVRPTGTHPLPRRFAMLREADQGYILR